MAQHIFLARNRKTDEIRIAWLSVGETEIPKIGNSIPKYAVIRKADFKELSDNYKNWIVVKNLNDRRILALLDVIEKLDTLSVGNNGLFQLVCDFGEKCANLSK